MEKHRRPYHRHAYHCNERQHRHRCEDDYDYIYEDEHPYYVPHHSNDGNPPSRYHEDEIYLLPPPPPYVRQVYRGNDEQFIPPYFFEEEALPAGQWLRPVAWHIIEVDDDDEVRYIAGAYDLSRRPRRGYSEQSRGRRCPRRGRYCRIL